MHRIPEDVKQFVRDHVAGTYNRDLTAMVNERFGLNLTVTSIIGLKSRMGLRSGIDGKFMAGMRRSPATEFKKGHVPINKGTKGMFPNAGGKTRFPKGHRPHNWLPVGTEVRDSYGYWKVKIAEPNKWRYKHILMWEEAHGPVPKGKVIVFLDGDRNHCEMENLALISMAANARRNQLHLSGSSVELGRVAVATAELIAAIGKREKAKQE